MRLSLWEVMELLLENKCDFPKNIIQDQKIMVEDWERILVFVYSTGLDQNAICLVTTNANERERFVTCMKILLLFRNTFRSDTALQVEAIPRDGTPSIAAGLKQWSAPQQPFLAFPPPPSPLPTFPSQATQPNSAETKRVENLWS